MRLHGLTWYGVIGTFGLFEPLCYTAQSASISAVCLFIAPNALERHRAVLVGSMLMTCASRPGPSRPILSRALYASYLSRCGDSSINSLFKMLACKGSGNWWGRVVG